MRNLPYADQVLDAGKPEARRPSKKLPPTPRQLACLERLGYSGPPLDSRQDASEAISALLAVGRRAR